MIAVIVMGDKPCEMGSPSCRAEVRLVDSAADAGVEALRNRIGTNALAAETMPCDAAEGISAVTQIMASPLRHAEVATAWSWAAVIVTGDAHCDVGSPPHRAEAMPVLSAADGVGALRCCC